MLSSFAIIVNIKLSDFRLLKAEGNSRDSINEVECFFTILIHVVFVIVYPGVYVKITRIIIEMNVHFIQKQIQLLV